MLSRRDDPLPIEAVRDLLGIARSLYAARKGQGASAAELARIAKIGRLLDDAIGLAARYAPGSVGARAAWRKAEDAIALLGALVDVTVPAEPIVRAAGRRVVPSR